MVNPQRISPERSLNIEVGNREIDTDDLLSRLESRVEDNLDRANRDRKLQLIEKIRRIKEADDTISSEQLKQNLEQELDSIDHEIIESVYNENNTGEDDVFSGIEEGIGFLEKLENKFSNSKELFDKISKAKGGMTGTLIGFLAAIKYFFSGKIGELPEGVELSWLESEDKSEESVSEGLNREHYNIQYALGINALYTLKGRERKNSKGILHSPEIKISNFGKLENESLNKNGIANRLKINGFNDDEVYNEIKIIIESGAQIDKLLGEEFPNWKNEKLIDVIILLNQKGFLTIGKLQEKIDNINFSINPEGNINQLFESLGSNLSIEISNGKINYSDIENGDKLIGNVSGILITNIATYPGKIYEKTESERLVNTIGREKEEDKEFLEKLITFKNAIIPNLKKLLPEDKNSDIDNFFNEEGRGLSLKELTELYLITGGNNNIEQIGGIKTTLLYLKFGNILFKDRRGLAGAFANELHLKIINNDTTVPEEVKNFFGNILSVIGKSVGERFKGVMLDIWNYTDTSTKIIVGGMIGAYFLSKKVRYIVSGVGTAATTFLALKIFDELSKDPEAKSRMNQHGINNSSDLGKILDETL